MIFLPISIIFLILSCNHIKTALKTFSKIYWPDSKSKHVLNFQWIKAFPALFIKHLIFCFSSIFIDALDPFFAVLILYGLTNFGMYAINSTYGCKDGLQTTTKQLWNLLWHEKKKHNSKYDTKHYVFVISVNCLLLLHKTSSFCFCEKVFCMLEASKAVAGIWKIT